MAIDGFSLNPIFGQVFPTFKTGDEWVDLKDETGKTDGIRQPHEVLQNYNDTGSPETRIDDEEVVNFLSDNLNKIPEDKIQLLVTEFTQYLQANPKGRILYDDEFYGAISDALAVIVSGKPQYYSESVEKLLASDDFLVRWTGADILFSTEIKDNVLKTAIEDKIRILLDQEKSNKEQIFAKVQDSDRVLYYPIQDTYDWYIRELNRLIKYLDK
jgi:hypothetical protein